jgi:hypothetical protein
MNALFTRVRPGPKVLFRDLDGEAVLLESESGMYYGLNELGTRIWVLLQEHGQLEPAFRVLLDEYEVPAERLQRELQEFVQRLASRGLVELS